MAEHRAPKSLRTRIIRGALLLAAAAGTAVVGAAGPAAAAPNGHAAGVARGATPAAVTVDAVRAAFPAAFVVCDGVTLTSQVAADAAEA
jgi:hypothetical protein